MPVSRKDPRTPRARALRRAMTDAERKLWRWLTTTLPLQSSHWRRQAPIGPYVVDFACHQLRIVIEVDGAQHGFDEMRRRDETRTAYLENAGYRVLRFWNHEIMREIQSVLDTIYTAVAARDLPTR
jgi:very-short-patch-repair endonuclease